MSEVSCVGSSLAKLKLAKNCGVQINVYVALTALFKSVEQVNIKGKSFLGLSFCKKGLYLFIIKKFWS